jgi:hypothetical protein
LAVDLQLRDRSPDFMHTHSRIPIRVLGLALMMSVLALPALAQKPDDGAPAAAGGSDADLAKQLSNPVASLVSVPMQFNWDQPIGPDKDTRMTLNFQPVVPIPLNDDWNLIARWIMPYVAQPRLSDTTLPASGLSDVVASFFISPAKPGKFVWGVGPVLLLPMNSEPTLGTGKWGAGPTFVILKQSGGWTYGALMNQIWSFAGDDFTGGVPRSDVNQMFLQPFVTFTNKKAVTFGVNLEASANWEADHDKWTVPMHFFVSKLTKFGPFPFSVQVGVAPFLAAPNGEPDWRLRFAGILLLPVKK